MRNGFIFLDVKDNPFYKMISKVTFGPSHCGIVYENVVIHAISPVVINSTIEDFIGISNGKYSLYTTGDENLDIESFFSAQKYLNVPYDFSFDFMKENTTYCSKLLCNALNDLNFPVPNSIKILELMNIYNKNNFIIHSKFYEDNNPFVVSPRMIQDSLTFLESN